MRRFLEPRAVDPNYWIAQARGPLVAAEGLRTLTEDAGYLLLEVGPGSKFSELVGAACEARRQFFPLEPSLPGEERREAGYLRMVGRLWLAGAPLNWRRLGVGFQRKRVPLPTYPFERRRFWIAGDSADSASESLAQDPKTLLPSVTVEMDRTAQGMTHAYIAPRTPRERELVSIWEETLGHRPIGVNFRQVADGRRRPRQIPHSLHRRGLRAAWRRRAIDYGCLNVPPAPNWVSRRP